jgi:hypothetical protein
VAALFPRWTNAVYALVLVTLVLIVVAAIAAPMIYVRTPYGTDQHRRVVQPVPFDHRHHARDDLIDCLYCHPDAETSEHAGIPPTEVCMGCHGQVGADSPQLALVRESWRTGVSIGWKRVNDVPDHVYFNHAVHVRGGAPLTMGWCIDCHRDHLSAPPNQPDHGYRWTPLTTCSACHR